MEPKLEEIQALSQAHSGKTPQNSQPKDAKSTEPQEIKPKTRTIDPEAERKKWSDRFDVAKSFQIPMFEKYAKWYDDMYAHVTNTNLAPWRSKVYMPIISSKIWDLISRFIQYRPGWEVTPRALPINVLSKEALDQYMSAMATNCQKLKMKLDYDYDNPLVSDSLPNELQGVMLDAAVTGQGVARVPWETRQTSYKNYVKGDTGVDYSKVQVTDAREGYNTLQGVSIFNFFLRPGAKSLQSSPWVIIYKQVPLYELENDENIDQTALKNVKSGQLVNEFAQYEASRNRLVQTEDANSLDTTTAMVNVYECHDKEFNEYIIYAEGDGGWVELYRGQNVYWHQKYPLVAFYVRRKPYTFWGESIFENSETLQAAINDIFNHFMDSYNMADGMIAIEEGSVVEPYIIQPGGELRYRGEMPKQFKFPSPDANNVQLAFNTINSAIENATISQYASGVPNSDTDTTAGTATGISKLMEAATTKVGYMRANFLRSWEEVGKMWVSNNQQFLNTDTVIRTQNKGEDSYEIISPADMLGIFGVKVESSSFEPISIEDKKQNFMEWQQNLLALQNASVAQAERTQDPNQAINLDFHQLAKEAAVFFSQKAENFIESNNEITPQQPTQPVAVTPPDQPNAPMPGSDMSVPQAAPEMITQAAPGMDTALAAPMAPEMLGLGV